MRLCLPFPAWPSPPVEEKISEHVAGLIRHGDCIQLGIGGLPNAIAKQLGGLRDLGIHTEMFTDAMADLVERGVVTGARKNINTGLHIGSFAGGSSHLYEVMSANPAFRIMPGSYAVDPMVIMQNDNLATRRSSTLRTSKLPPPISSAFCFRSPLRLPVR